MGDHMPGLLPAAEGSLDLFQGIKVFLQPVDMLLHLDNGRPEFGHGAERALANPWQLRIGTALTHRPRQEPHHKQSQTRADEQTPSQHSRFHPIVLLSMATPLLPRTHLSAPGPHSGTQPRPDHPPTPATAAFRCLASVRLMAIGDQLFYHHLLRLQMRERVLVLGDQSPACCRSAAGESPPPSARQSASTPLRAGMI